MLSKILVLLAAAATSTTAFTIPVGQPNGIYTAYYSINGTEVHELLGAIDTSGGEVSRSPSIRAREMLSKRSQTWCGCGFGMDHGDCDQANACLQSWCGSGNTLQNNQAIYCHSNSAVAFACNYDNFATSCNTADVINSDQHITASCGWYIAGTYRLDGHGHLDIGYMNWDSNFCGAAEGSGSNHC